MSAIHTRAERIRANRPRGIYTPINEVSPHLACGWRLLDDCPGRDEALLAPPRQFSEGRAA
jgi:hypothetical protein